MDGTSDGVYQLVLDVFDKAGNNTQATFNYIYDTLPPKVTLSYPQDGRCVSALDSQGSSI